VRKEQQKKMVCSNNGTCGVCRKASFNSVCYRENTVARRDLGNGGIGNENDMVTQQPTVKQKVALV
jgi:hypothetical protein